MLLPRARMRQDPRVEPLGDRIRRKRTVLCRLTCKSRKVKCDPQAPVCTRCFVAGYPERCKYDNRIFQNIDEDNTNNSNDNNNCFLRSPSSVLSLSPASTLRSNYQRPLQGVFYSRHDLPDQAVSHLPDDSARHPQQQHPPHPMHPVTPPPNAIVDGNDGVVVVEPTSGHPLIQGVSINTQLHVITHSVNIISYLDSLCSFLRKTATDHPVLGAHRYAVQNLVTRCQLSTTPVDDSDEAMERSLPPERVFRALMLAYFKHFESFLINLHYPSFWRRYNTFWAGNPDRLAHFNALLLAAMSCARCLRVDSTLSFDGDCSTIRAETIR